MHVLVITGDKTFGPGHPRYDLQAAVCELSAVYWGRGSLWPNVPSGKYDTVTAQDPFWRGLFGWYVARRVGARFNVQVHTDLSVYGGVRHVLSQIVLRHADSVRVVSEKIKKQVEHSGTNAQSTVLPIYIELAKYQDLQRQSHAQKTILWLGRFEEEKDPLYALEVLSDVRKIIDARLVMLGSGSLQRALEEYAKGAPVEFPGWQDPLPYLAAADVVLSTSRHESFGASIVEALAAGIPVVAPDVGIAKQAGATVVPREKMPEAIVELLKSEKRGELQLPMLSKEAWAAAWIASL